MYLERMTGYVYTIFLNQKQVRYREIRTTAKTFEATCSCGITKSAAVLQKIFMGLYKKELLYAYVLIFKR